MKQFYQRLKEAQHTVGLCVTLINMELSFWIFAFVFSYRVHGYMCVLVKLTHMKFIFL